MAGATRASSAATSRRLRSTITSRPDAASSWRMRGRWRRRNELTHAMNGQLMRSSYTPSSGRFCPGSAAVGERCPTGRSSSGDRGRSRYPPLRGVPRARRASSHRSPNVCRPPAHDGCRATAQESTRFGRLRLPASNGRRCGSPAARAARRVGATASSCPTRRSRSPRSAPSLRTYARNRTAADAGSTGGGGRGG